MGSPTLGQTLLRPEILCRDRKLQALLNPVVTRTTVSRHKASLSTWGWLTLSRHKMLCRDPRPGDTATPCRVCVHRCRVGVPARRARPLRAPRLGRVPGLRSMSRHRKLCRDTVPGRPCSDRKFSVATQTQFWAVACPVTPPGVR